MHLGVLAFDLRLIDYRGSSSTFNKYSTLHIATALLMLLRDSFFRWRLLSSTVEAAVYDFERESDEMECK